MLDMHLKYFYVQPLMLLKYFCRTSMMDWIFHSMKMLDIRLECFLLSFPLMAESLSPAVTTIRYMSTTFRQTNWHCVCLLIQYDSLYFIGLLSFSSLSDLFFACISSSFGFISQWKWLIAQCPEVGYSLLSAKWLPSCLCRHDLSAFF